MMSSRYPATKSLVNAKRAWDGWRDRREGGPVGHPAEAPLERELRADSKLEELMGYCK